MISTNHLTIRRYVPEDTCELLPILSDPVTMGFWPRPFSREEVEGWIERSIRSYEENGFGRYAVVLKETGQIIGDCGILKLTVDGEDVYDLGYIIHHRYWGRGFGTEAAAAVRDYAFGVLKIPTLHANMPCDHIASRRVAEKIGMTRVREFRNERNRGIPTFLYTITRALMD